MKRRLLVLACLLAPCAGMADAVAYRSRVDIAVANNDKTAFHHVHDWSSKKLDALFDDIANHDKFFSAANDFSYVEAKDGQGKLLFRSPSPALTKLWISPDGQFFVGLSGIRRYNPYQLVVWQRDGKVLHREHIASEVARLTSEQRSEFSTRFPEAQAFLSKRYFNHGNAAYLDFSLQGMSKKIGMPALEYLRKLSVPHPYSGDFAESVTNSVVWFDDSDPALRMERTALGWMLYLRSPGGRQMAIQVS
jgi:hypothetical protein